MKDKKPSSWDIRERSFEYALRAVNLYQFLQEEKDQADWIIDKQYLRSATSIGAKIEEAKSEESRADFIHKYSIAKKEARESLYWLCILNKSEIVSSQRLLHLMNETKEIIAVITTIFVKVKKNKPS